MVVFKKINTFIKQHQPTNQPTSQHQRGSSASLEKENGRARILCNDSPS